MHSGDHNAALGLHDCSDGFRATEQRFSATARRQENWIVVLNRGGKNNKVRSVRMLREMLGDWDVMKRRLREGAEFFRFLRLRSATGSP